MSNQHVLTIMEVSINDMEQRDAVVGGIETIASLLYRYTYFEKLYLHTEPFLAEEIRGQVEKILKDLYTVVLVFLFKARNYFDQGVFGVSSILSTSDEAWSLCLSDFKAVFQAQSFQLASSNDF
jgi:hypothetical protein